MSRYPILQKALLLLILRCVESTRDRSTRNYRYWGRTARPHVSDIDQNETEGRKSVPRRRDAARTGGVLFPDLGLQTLGRLYHPELLL